MKRIFLDTETTGLRPNDGDRIVEIGAVAYQNDHPDPEEYHQYINPQRDMPKEALAVHGITGEFLRDKPVFAAIADTFIEFVRGGELVIHNATFDEGFLNAELARADKPPLRDIAAKITCSLEWSRTHNRHANGHTLDALCKQYGIRTDDRAKYHSAIVDTHLLAKVYPLLTRQQGEIRMAARAIPVSANGGPVPVRLATAQEQQEHAKFIQEHMQTESNLPPLYLASPS